MSNSQYPLQPYDQSSDSDGENLPVRLIRQALEFQAEVKTTMQLFTIEATVLRPRVTQALLDELKARWNEGSL